MIGRSEWLLSHCFAGLCIHTHTHMQICSSSYLCLYKGKIIITKNGLYGSWRRADGVSASFVLTDFVEIDKCGVDCFVVEMLSCPGTNQNLD